MLLPLVLAFAACASTGGISREPFTDITVPASFIPYSDQWVLIQNPKIHAAKLVYMAPLPPDSALSALRQELVRHGWNPREAIRFVNPQGFSGVTMEFLKGGDSCRVTVIEGPNATHVEMAVARQIPR